MNNISYLSSFGILRSVEWHFHNDVWGQPMGPIFKGQAVSFTELNCLYGTCVE
jgi:hypothetical protein